MTTIEEMDEFFNFEEAANPLGPSDTDFNHLTSGPYDIDLAFAEPESDENSFTCLQHFTATPAQEQFSLNLQNATEDTTMMGPGDYADFPRWIDGLNFPTKPCQGCRLNRRHCKFIKEGHRKGSCTSCVALGHSCSLAFDSQRRSGKSNISDGRWPESLNTSSNSSKRNSGDFNTITNDELSFGRVTSSQPCEYCLSRGYDCKLIEEGERKGSCTSCVALEHICSFAPHENIEDLSIEDGLHPNPYNSWILTKIPIEESNMFIHSKASTHSRLTPDVQVPKLPDEVNSTDAGDTNPKAGVRFSREALRVLRQWLLTHHRHPYPSDEEKESLQRQTGLNKLQITNWLANARRRGKVRAQRSKSPLPVSNYANGMDIPRAATPALASMNPMERWKHSPPEHEPASITAISKAITSSSFLSDYESPYSHGQSDDGSSRSVANVSSTSSLGTSNSSGASFASAFSHRSRGSFGSFGNRGRRRRRQAAKPNNVMSYSGPPRTFQCTFCTETFKTKHDWQRHEKSLHLSLERWICCPKGPSAHRAEYNHVACVYCGLANPPQDHSEEHNYSSCAERSLEERTFYRKDHLRQHLNLVHDAKFQAWSMDSWKVATPEIRSRCGFCGIAMDSWSIRVDHLAEHFKSGKNMADWKGDWGFEQQVLEVVENGIPPYLIHDERNTPVPFEASKELAGWQQSTLYDAVKCGLVEYINKKVIHGLVPSDDELLVEAKSILGNLKAFSSSPEIVPDSWFLDLIRLNGPAQQKSIGPQDSRRKVDVSYMIDLSNNNSMEERDLVAFFNERMDMGVEPTDLELKTECYRILEEYDATSKSTCEGALNWFKYLINSSNEWLPVFRRRAELSRRGEMASQHVPQADAALVDYNLWDNNQQEKTLAEYVRLQMSLGFIPSDSDIQEQARRIHYGTNDHRNKTFLDDPINMHLFKRQNGLAPLDAPDLPVLTEIAELGNPIRPTSTALESHTPSITSLHWDLGQVPTSFNMNCITDPWQSLMTVAQDQPSTNTNPTRPLPYFLSDTNCYRRLVRELSRFVASCMSPNNPNQHIPTDEEIQNQARWVIYDDDDPWNQTAADNAEWLIRFKRDVGLAPADEGPGLPTTDETWTVQMGGSGFSPPYAFPNKQPVPFSDVETVPITMKEKVVNVKASTANKFLNSMATRYEPLAAVFCSRELEQGLNEFVKAESSKGTFPSDEALKSKAREILRTDETAADDAVVLDKFKALHGIRTYHVGAEFPTLDHGILEQFDHELEGMDFSTDQLADIDVDKSTNDDVNYVEYANLFRVHTATASPLRRRVSLANAAKTENSRRGGQADSSLPRDG